LFHVYFITDKLIGLPDKRLSKFKAQDRGIEPVKIGPPAFGLFDENVEELVL